MNIIIRNHKSHSKVIKNVKNLSIGDEPGIFIEVDIEVDKYKDFLDELDKEGYKPNLVGKIINLDVSSVSAFD